MSNEMFYVRSHFPVPTLDADSWLLRVGGIVKEPLLLRLADLLEMPSKSALVTLECAGNGRSMMQPRVDGEPWALGAVSTAEWTGVLLEDVLSRAGIKAGAREIVFRGADAPAEGPSMAPASFERSLSIEDVREAQPILAYAMNGQALPQQHGHPVRLIVPTWYAVASVKWLNEIEVIDHEFKGYFQTEKYMYEWNRDGDRVREPVRHPRVRALITQPGEGEVLNRDRLAIRGLAWSGFAPIAKVEVSVDGRSWRQAQIQGAPDRAAWQRWELVIHVDRPGQTTLQARATDCAGNSQPERAEWNRLGYGNNSVQRVTIDWYPVRKQPVRKVQFGKCPRRESNPRP
jgi:DMSO/TMAO reductase YedYZ molybdopterin-dependent catalytic subunit